MFTGELIAIMIAINKVHEMGISNSIICSDSSSALICLKDQKSETRQDIILEILQILYAMEQTNKKVQFIWVPAHGCQEMKKQTNWQNKLWQDKLLICR